MRFALFLWVVVIFWILRFEGLHDVAVCRLMLDLVGFGVGLVTGFRILGWFPGARG